MCKAIDIPLPNARFTRSVRATTRLEPKRRTIPLSRQRHIIGRYAPGAGRPAIPFESHLECLAMRAIHEQAPTAEIQSQPTTLSFVHRDRVRTYTPDLVVTMGDVPQLLRSHGFDFVTFIEIKPFKRLKYLHPLWPLIVRILRHTTGVPLIILTDRDLTTWMAREVQS